MDFMNVGSLPRETVAFIDSVMESNQVWKEHDILELALAALTYNLKAKLSLYNRKKIQRFLLKKIYEGGEQQTLLVL